MLICLLIIWYYIEESKKKDEDDDDEDDDDSKTEKKKTDEVCDECFVHLIALLLFRRSLTMNYRSAQTDSWRPTLSFD